MFLWRILGDAGNDSGGGDMEVFALTDGPTHLPHPQEALDEANSGRGYVWSEVHSITAVGKVRCAWDASRRDENELLNKLIATARSPYS